MSKDSIGIEFVGEAVVSEGNPEGVYVSLTEKQKEVAKELIKELKTKFSLTDTDIYKHSKISYKNSTEASSVTW